MFNSEEGQLCPCCKKNISICSDLQDTKRTMFRECGNLALGKLNCGYKREKDKMWLCFIIKFWKDWASFYSFVLQLSVSALELQTSFFFTWKGLNVKDFSLNRRSDFMNSLFFSTLAIKHVPFQQSGIINPIRMNLVQHKIIFHHCYPETEYECHVW